MPTGGVDGWGEYRRLILAELERVANELRDLNERLAAMQVELATLKVRAGMWGAIAGGVPGLVAAILYLLSRD